MLTEEHQAEKYVMHELYSLEKVAREAYAEYNFPQGVFRGWKTDPQDINIRSGLAVIHSLTHFANITLSSFYFTATKDSLYTDAKHGPHRQRILAIFDKVCLYEDFYRVGILNCFKLGFGYHDFNHGTSSPTPCGRDSPNARCGG